MGPFVVIKTITSYILGTSQCAYTFAYVTMFVACVLLKSYSWYHNHFIEKITFAYCVSWNFLNLL